MRITLLTVLLVPLACSNAADPTVPDAGPTRVDGGTAPAAYDGLVINEVAAAGDPDDWFELFNGSARVIDLAGVTYSDEPQTDPAKAVFPAGTTIAPGAHLLKLVNDTDPGFKLASDEAIAIFAPGGAMIDVADWAEGGSPAGASWGRFPDGTGAFETLATPTPGAANVRAARLCGNGVIDVAELCDGAALAGRTCASEGFSGGALGCAVDCARLDTSGCAAPPAEVVINEVTSAGDDRIELVNEGARVADVSGWVVHDADWVQGDPTTDDQRYVLAAGSTIAPGGYLVLVKGAQHGFGLGDADRLALRRPDGTIADDTTWSAGQASPSWCRLPDPAGAFTTCRATFGAANEPRPAAVCGDGTIDAGEVCDGAALGGQDCVAQGFASGALACAATCAAFDTRGCVARAPRVVINEATSAGDDQIELFNGGTADADLGGWSVSDSDPTNTPYAFPAGTTLAAGMFVVLVKGTHHTFGLGGSDGVTLRDANDAVVDMTAWSSGDADPAWCRRPDGTGAFVTCGAATFGATNGP